LALAALLYLPLIFLGYGTDVDSYHVVEAGERIVEGLPYEHSREPGFLVHEVATGVLDRIGGSVLTNLGSVALALGALGSFMALCRRLRVPHPVLLGLTLAVHPLFWASATSTMDYVWALGFGLAGGVLLWDRRWGWAGLLFGLAAGSRVTVVLLVAVLAGFVFWQRAEDRRGVLLSVGLGLGLGVLCFVPTLVQYDWTLGFLVPVGADEQAGWSWVERFGRFGYKNVYVWGLPAVLVLVGALVRAAAERPRLGVQRRTALGLAAAGVLVYEALYLRYPLEPEYLLPLVPFVLLGVATLVGRRWLVALFGTVLLYNAVSLNLARPDRPNHAQSVEVGLWLEPGHLATDVAQRLQVRECRSFACWTERSANGTFPNAFDAP
jgi:hypothetical protein